MLSFPPRNHLGTGVDTEAWVPPIEQVWCACSMLPMALFWFGIIFPRKELELGKGVGRRSEETCVQRFWS